MGRVGVILRDATLEDIANFLTSDAGTLEAAVELAETIETMARYDVHDAGWSRRLDLAVIIQAVAQVSMLGAPRDRWAPILAALRKLTLEDLGQIPDVDPLKSPKLRAAIQAYAVSEVRRIVAEVKAGELTGDALRAARFARLEGGNGRGAARGRRSSRSSPWPRRRIPTPPFSLLESELAAADQAWEALYSKRVAAEDACSATVPSSTQGAELRTAPRSGRLLPVRRSPLARNRPVHPRIRPGEQGQARSQGAGGDNLRPHGGRGRRERGRGCSPRDPRQDRVHARQNARRPDLEGRNTRPHTFRAIRTRTSCARLSRTFSAWPSRRRHERTNPLRA